jgi:hypothetical protein
MFGISNDECYAVLLKYSNAIGIKLLHKVVHDIVVPEKLIELIESTLRALEDSLEPYDVIVGKKSNAIPFIGNGHIYYLFLGKQLVYIGQTTNLPSRIGEHRRSGKVFDFVACIPVDPDYLLVTEKFYIKRDLPVLNIVIMSNVEYFSAILDITDCSSISYMEE